MNKYGLKPLNMRVIVAPKDRNISQGGIIMNDTSTEQYSVGEVVAIDDKITEFKVGDVIYYGRYASTKFDHQGYKLEIVHLSEVLGVEEE